MLLDMSIDEENTKVTPASEPQAPTALEKEKKELLESWRKEMQPGQGEEIYVPCANVCKCTRKETILLFSLNRKLTGLERQRSMRVFSRQSTNNY